MTLSDILESNNIRSDRYAMTAISNICKAFGYKNYSKESWPWGKDMQFEWQCSKGINTDVLEAELLLEKVRTTALEESNKDNNIYNIILEDPSLISLHNQIKNLLNRLNNLKNNLSDINDTSLNINNISENTISKIDDIL